MAVPKKRRSKSKKRSHRANWREKAFRQAGRALSAAVPVLRDDLKDEERGEQSV